MQQRADRTEGQRAFKPTGWRYGVTLGTIALACFLSAWVVRQTLNLGVGAYPVWAPAGIALGAMLLFGYRVWPGVALGTLWFALFLGVSLPVAMGAAFGSTLEPIAAQWMLEKQEFQPSLRRLRDVLNFLLLAVLLAPALNATTNSFNLCLSGLVPWSQLGSHWGTVWLGDSMGVLIFTPVILNWLGRPLSPLTALRSLPGMVGLQQLPWRKVEAMIWGVLLVSVSWVVFTCTPQTAIARYPLEYLPFPLLVWAALRLGQRITVLGSLTVSLIAIGAAVMQVGPFIVKANNDLLQAILLLQAFLGVMTVTALVLSTAVAERWDSEERFRSMFEGAAIGIGLDNARGHIVDSNPALQEMLGYSREELQQLTFSDFTYLDDREIDLQLFAEMLAGRRDAYQLEKRHLRKDGQMLWVRLTNSLVRNELGQPRFTIGMVEDITARKQAEEALQQSEARFRVVAETAACAIMVYQGDYLRYVNQATETITGYSREELLAMPFWHLTHPDYQDLVKHRGLARQQGEVMPSRYEIKIVTRAGEERWVDLTAGVITFEGQPAALATAYDITERKQAEAKLQQAAGRERLLTEMAQRIRRSLNLTEVLNTTVAEVRQFLKADRVFIAQIESDSCYPVAESVDPAWNSIMNWVLDRPAVEAIQELFMGDETGHRAIRVVHNTREVELTPFLTEYYYHTQLQAGISAPIVIDGELFGVLLINQCSNPRQWQPFEVEFLQQLTTQVEIAIQQGQLYQQLQQLATSLEEQVEDRTTELKQRMLELQNLNQVKDLLLHAVSHDLKTPIQGTLMLLDRLLNRCCASEASIAMTRPVAEQLLQSTRQQLTLLNCLIEQQQDTDPPPVVNWQSVQVGTQLQTVLTEMQPLFEQNQVKLINYLNQPLPPVKANPSQLGEVFHHLLTNAVKHNPPGITVTLTGAVQPSNVSSPTLPAGSSVLCCTITDNGVGMTAEQCDRLFQLYIRSIDNPHLTGIGLGLHQCRQIIRAHGGQIGVTSDLGHGTSFWFTLPLASAD